MTAPDIIILCILVSFLVMIASCLCMSRSETQKESKAERAHKDTDNEKE